MKGFSRHLLIGIIIFVVSCSVPAMAQEVDGSDILAEMYRDPSRFVCIGTENFGLSLYLDKDTVNVHQYAPPIYIIAFETVYHLFDYRTTQERAGDRYATMGGITRYKYDFDSREMYIEKYDSNGQPYWKYVDVAPISSEQSRKMSGQDFRDRYRAIMGGEVAFYLAYGMSFFDKPVMAEDFIENGRSRMIPLVQLNLKEERDENSQIGYKYNHRTRQVETWRYTYNKNSKSIDEKQIK